MLLLLVLLHLILLISIGGVVATNEVLYSAIAFLIFTYLLLPQLMVTYEMRLAALKQSQ